MSSTYLCRYFEGQLKCFASPMAGDSSKHWKFLFCWGTHILPVVGSCNFFCFHAYHRSQQKVLCFLLYPQMTDLLWDVNYGMGLSFAAKMKYHIQAMDAEKLSTSALPSRIKRVFYMSSEGSNLLHEVFPEVNHTVLEQLSKVDCVVYALGSLFTSVCPSLVLRGIGETIASRSIPKVSNYAKTRLGTSSEWIT
ncbi:uncharacterized protein [Miscanthus floridulus]|uniref:uncharacterized protein isoform X3 n=1 Tax=Miscanthus floridulus TaxID=154761 RepID=UPI003458357C